MELVIHVLHYMSVLSQSVTMYVTLFEYSLPSNRNLLTSSGLKRLSKCFRLCNFLYTSFNTYHYYAIIFNVHQGYGGNVDIPYKQAINHVVIPDTLVFE